MHEKLNLHLFDQDTQTTLLNAPGNDLSAEMKTYYEKRLLDAAEPELVHDQFADKYPIPQGSGKTIEFRKYSALPKSLTALTEGTTPPGSTRPCWRIRSSKSSIPSSSFDSLIVSD